MSAIEREPGLDRGSRAARAAAEALEALAIELGTSLDLGRVLQRVAEATRELCRADLVRVALRESDDAVVYRYIAGGRAAGYEDLRLRPGQGFVGYVLATGRPFRTADAPNDPQAHPEFGRRLIDAEGVKTAMVLPILSSGEVEGVLSVARRTPLPFDDEDERIGGRLADYASVAIRNARLYEEARTRQREAESLAAVARTLNTLDLEAALQNIAESACALLRAEVATVFRLDAESGTLVLAAGGGPGGSTRHANETVPRGMGLVGLAVAQRAPVVSADLLGDPRIVYEPAMRARVEAARHRVGLAVPLTVQGEMIGALFVGLLPRRSFSREEIRLVTAFADHAAVAMTNAQLYHDAQRANRAKDEFLAMLGHELRNPLGAIAGAVGVLRMPDLPGPTAERARDVIGRELGHLSRLVDDLLDVTRVTTGKITLSCRPLDLADLVGSTMTAWRAAGRFDRHRVAVTTRSVWIDADPTRVEQVLGNLVGNALKYTPADGDITVRVTPDGADALLEVADTGVGIPPALRSRVFDLFVQGDRALDRAQGGLGIGLTLVKALVGLHGGTVDVRSDGPDRGSIFTVRLPSVGVRATRPAARGAVAPRGPRRRILLVEDNDDGREMLRVQLSLAGHEVHEAADGPTGIAVAQKVAPDIALIDVGLPGLDGYEVARRIRAGEHGASVVLIALTGYGQADDRRRAMEAGFDAHVTKPVSPERLAELLTIDPKQPRPH